MAYTLDLLKDIGSVRNSEFAFGESSLSTSVEPAEYRAWYNDLEDRVEAMKNVVTAYDYVKVGADSDNTPITGPKDPDLNPIKELLNSGHLLTFSSRFSGSRGTRLADGRCTIYTLNTDALTEEQKSSSLGHMLTIVGYDDNAWCDLDQDGQVDEYEKGAFIVANSWGTSYGDNGYFLLMYDAVNAVSNCERLNTPGRESFFEQMGYLSIEVANRDLNLYATVFVRQRYRNQVEMATAKGADSVMQPTAFTEKTKQRGGAVSFDGVNDTVQGYWYIVNFSKYTASPGGQYILNVTDNTEGEDTRIFPVKWYDFGGTQIGYNSGLHTITGAGTESFSFEWIPVTNISLSSDYSGTTINIRQEVQLSAAVAPENATEKLYWSSSNPSVASVSSSGLVTGIDGGTATITVTSSSGKTACVTYIVYQPVTGISLNKTTSHVYRGQRDYLYATITPTSATCQDIIWTSSNPDVVTVDENGRVYYVGLGTAVVTATTVDGNFSASCTYTNTDDYGNTRDEAVVLNVNQPMEGEIGYEGDVDFFIFCLDDGEYLLYVEGMQDAVIKLQYWSGRVIAVLECTNEAENIYSLTFTADGSILLVSAGKTDGGTGTYTLRLVPVENE